MNYYGWIPIISDDISFGRMKNPPPIAGDDSDKVVFFDERRRPITCDRTLYYDEGNKLTRMAIDIPEMCFLNVKIEDICNKGLVKFSWNEITIAPVAENKELRKLYAQIIYNSIKDLYHSHIHHDPLDSYALRPSSCDNQQEAITDILNQYLEKTVSYHKQLSEVLKGTVLKKRWWSLIGKIFRDLFHIAEYIYGIQQANMALGEFTYAVGFIDNYIPENDKSRLKDVFSNVSESMKVIRERIAWRLGFFVAFIALGIATWSLMFNAINLFHKW